ncbi:MAG TPA: hypothetical protein VEL31_26625 [Ktedonobacteraceae bacterium]|nr:hypothetical protein [Ktedonobacteraceae bacterium]
MTITLAEIKEVEASEDYQVDQDLVKFDALLERINALLRKSHESDKAFNRYLRKQHASMLLCDHCKREV